MYKHYKTTRGYENLQRAQFEGEGPYDIPWLYPCDPVDADINWISFNFAKGCEDPEIHGVHFFIDDYQFTRVWTDPDKYLPMLRRFKAVCAPDFSPYSDWPKIMQLYNHYRKHWLAAYWKDEGINVIPTITWSDEASLEWCFDGEPKNSSVALSSQGVMNTAEGRRMFDIGFKEMMDRLTPTQILLKGIVPKICEPYRDLIVPIPTWFGTGTKSLTK